MCLCLAFMCYMVCGGRVQKHGRPNQEEPPCCLAVVSPHMQGRRQYLHAQQANPATLLPCCCWLVAVPYADTLSLKLMLFVMLTL